MQKLLGFVYHTPDKGTFQIKAFERSVADAVASLCYKQFTFSHINERPL